MLRPDASLQNLVHLRVLQIIENLNYITKYERYEDEPKRKNVRFCVFFATVFTEGSLEHFVRSQGKLNYGTGKQGKTLSWCEARCRDAN